MPTNRRTDLPTLSASELRERAKRAAPHKKPPRQVRKAAAKLYEKAAQEGQLGPLHAWAAQQRQQVHGNARRS